MMATRRGSPISAGRSIRSLGPLPIYWTRNSIPALRDLAPNRRNEIIRPVLRNVWSHWQVWSPFLVMMTLYAVFLIYAPQFPYRLWVVAISFGIFSYIAAIPFNHYLQH